MKKFFQIFTYISGMSIFCGCAAFIMVLLFSLDKREPIANSYEKYWQKFENQNYLVQEDFIFSAWIGVGVLVFFVLINVLWIVLYGADTEYYNGVLQSLKNPFVRFLGTVCFFAFIGGALSLTMEYFAATPKYPAKYEEVGEFMGGFAIIGTVIYFVIRLFTWIIRKISGKKIQA